MESDLSEAEILNQKHKKEKKDLQAKVQALKKTATKGDKKKKKEVLDEIAKLESELHDKQSMEVAALGNGQQEVENLTEQTYLESVPKVSKAQKRRNKKELNSRERQQRIVEQEIENLSGLRHCETEKVKEKLRKINLMIYDIPSDGDCLYFAVDHSKQRVDGQPIGIPSLRRLTADYIEGNPDTFLPFLTCPETGGPLNEAQFIDYCNKVRSTRQWGGQVELNALAQVLKMALIVIQADGPDLIMGEEYANAGKIYVTYHRHQYQLGEHYNSVQLYVDDVDDI